MHNNRIHNPNQEIQHFIFSVTYINFALTYCNGHATSSPKTVAA
jgi:hypothetical protein